MANKAEKIAQARLARGEISDSEYSRIMLDVSAPVTKVRVKKLTAAALLVVLVLATVASVAAVHYWQSARTGTAYGVIGNETFASANHPPAGVTVGGNGVIFVNQSATILVEGAPVWHPGAGDYFLSYRVVNPTFVVKKGIALRVEFINMDNKTHNFAVTGSAPPYAYMPMGGEGMMSRSTGQWTGMSSMLPGISSQQDNTTLYREVTMAMTFPHAGTFWYLCQYPGHAEMGMYGRITVYA